MTTPSRPTLLQKAKQRGTSAIDNFQHQLAYIDALPQMTLLGLLIGIFSGLLIVTFRGLIDSPLNYVLANGSEDFQSLSPLWRFLLPFLGACTIGFLLHFMRKEHRALDVAHVLDRLHNH